MLLTLCATNTRKALVGLWSDLRSLSKAEFEAEIDKRQGEFRSAVGKVARKKAPAKKCAPEDDRASSRISYHLTGNLNLSEKEAIRKLMASLKQRGTGADKLPRDDGSGLREWLEALLDRVPGSVVMDAALKINR